MNCDLTQTLNEIRLAATVIFGIAITLILLWPEKRARPETVDEHCMDEKQFEEDTI